jgi:hypothetical protein
VGTRYHTVVELPEFVRSAESAGMVEEDRAQLIDLLALDPDAGVSLGGGLYKVRFARRGAGKSGGYRVIYFYRDAELPVFLLNAFAKNQKSNLTARERADLIEDCRRIAQQYGSQK